MPSDRSRRTDGLRDGYTGVVAQQGRVTLDRDFNAEHGFLAGRIEAEARDTIGPCGTPDNGFAISIPQTSPPGPPLWSPPAPLSPPTQHSDDFLISPGTMYVGGQRAVFTARPAGHPVTYSYYDQPDWVLPPAPPEIRGRELLFLALAEQEVSAVEDSDLLEVALGGPDTTQRLRLLRRVYRETVQAPDCTTAWSEAVALWRVRDGLLLKPATMQLCPQLRLQVGFSDDGATPDPCDPIAQNGYLGAENQTIRVQISDAGNTGSSGGQAKLLWGYDNASFLYRATALTSNAAMLTIAPPPPDAFHVPQTAQVVEILRTAAVLASEPDVTDPTGQRSIVRCVASPTGVVRRLAQPYGPADPGDPTSYIVLDQALPAEYLADTTPLFLRVWQSEIAFDPTGDTILLTDDVTGASTGVEVTISVPTREVLTAGAYWLLAVRPSTPQAVYPERLLSAPQPPDGPRLWACPLALIDWTNRENPTVTDCRNLFDDLVELTRRRGGCCTVAMSPADLANGTGVQDAIDRAAGLERGATVCLAPGRYPLTAPLRLTGAHTGLTIEACGGPAIFSAVEGDQAAFSDGMVVLAGADNITLRGLTMLPAMAPLPQAVATSLANLLSRFVSVPNIRALIGVHAADSLNLALEDCNIEFTPGRVAATLDIFGAGVFVQGDCFGLSVQDCSFTSLIAPTFNRLSNAPALLARDGAAAVTSPPLAPAEFALGMLDLTRASLETIATNTATEEAASNVLVVTVGCLGMSKLATDRTFADTIPCQFGNGSLRDNAFSNLTMALYGIADAHTLRLQDNHAAQCIGGFWLQLTGWHTPQDPKAASLFTPMWQNAQAFAERLMLDAIGLTYPLPPGTATEAPPTLASGPASLFVLGNQVEPVPSTRDGSTALPDPGQSRSQRDADTSVSLLIASNRLRSRSGPQAPTALLLVPEQERCAITGNLILSETAPNSDPGPSLWLVPDTLANGSELLSVVGNVLQGRSDLSTLTRVGLTPAQSWAVYNAMPA